MKTGLFRIGSTLFAAISLVAVYFAAESWHLNATSAQARDLVTTASTALLREGNRDVLISFVDSPSTFAMPDLEFLPRFQQLLAMDPPSGEISMPPLFSSTPGRASLGMRAHFSYGTADIQAELEYREGAWRLLRYELTPGLGVM